MRTILRSVEPRYFACFNGLGTDLAKPSFLAAAMRADAVRIETILGGEGKRCQRVK